jgi:lysophospholipase L1-like esterase
MRDSARLGNADYFCANGANLSTILTTPCKDKNFEEQLLAELLVTKKYDKIIINLGVNDCGIVHSAIMERYDLLLNLIRHHQPDAKIILQGVLMVTEAFLSGTSAYSPSTIASLNSRIKALADGKSIYYIEANPYFTKANGYLYDDLAYSDGIHLKNSRYWADWLSYAVGQLGI